MAQAVTDLAVTYVEIDIDYCSLSFGVAPCTAVLSADNPTGLQKCFNTRSSCADPAHFTNAPVTLRFGKDTGHNPVEVEAIPNLVGVSMTAGIISLGEDLGKSEQVTVTLEDIQHPDTGPGFDKYVGERTYPPYAQGTLWGRFRARQRYLKGRPFRLIRGFVGQALADMETRHYVIDSFSGPDVDGKFTIKARDILTLLDGDQAQAPALSQGALSGDIGSGAGSLTLTPSGIGSTYATSGKGAIGGSEIVSFTRSGDTVTLTARGLYNTGASSHSAGDGFQQCVEYLGASPADIVADLMTTHGGVDPAYIPTSSWDTEVDTFNRRNYTGIVAVPTPVRSLIKEIIQQAGLAIWWDPVEQLVFLQVLRAVTADARVFDESSVMSLSIMEQPDKRISQVWVYYGQRNPLGQQDLITNYRSWEDVADPLEEANYGVPAIETINSRWIAFGGSSEATRIGYLQLGRYVQPPRKFTFEVMKGSAVSPPILGAGYYIEHAELQDFDGTQELVPIQITRMSSEEDRWIIEAEENIYTSYDAADLLTAIIDSNIRTINLRSIFDTLYSDPLAGDVVSFVVNAGVIVGGAPAIDVGSWPTLAITGNRTSGSPTITGISSTASLGVGMFVHGAGIPNHAKILSKTSNSITLDANATSGSSTSTSLTVDVVILNLSIYGRVQGAGGPGGGGAAGPAGIPSPGTAGYTGLYTRYGINVVVEVGGELAGGGGGGGGAGTRVYNNHSGGGGGGGAGDPAGVGGPRGATGPAQYGFDGSLDAGGQGGFSWSTNGGIFAQPGPYAIYGGPGGSPGSPGSTGDSSDSAGAVGGAAGNAIDGVSYVKLTNSGTIAGPQVN